MRYLWLALVGLLSANAMAVVRTDTVKYEFGGVGLVGAVVYDDALAGKPGGVVVFPEWWGANDYARRRAEMLASQGYVAFVADMYGEGKTTDDAAEAGKWAAAVYGDPKALVGRAAAAVEALKGTGRCDPNRIAAIGYCMGGSVALNLARSGADLKAVVAFHAGLANKVGRSEIKAKIAVFNGADDAAVGPEETAKFEQEMREAKADWYLTLFGNSVHAFTNPASDQRRMPNIAYNEAADRRSWEMMRAMLAECLRTGK